MLREIHSHGQKNWEVRISSLFVFLGTFSFGKGIVPAVQGQFSSSHYKRAKRWGRSAGSEGRGE
jgi:hypothetical protein